MLRDTKIKVDSVDLVATAGQTIWHDPELILVEPDVDWIDHPIETRSTFAIGQSAVIAERTGCTVEAATFLPAMQVVRESGYFD